jgi:biotin transport system substrate-specific component
MEISPAAARIFGVTAFVAMLGMGAHIKFFMPGNPVPVTLLTLFVLLAGALLGPYPAMGAVATYIALGVTGVPLFAGAADTSGLLYLLGPTGGYLAGFMVAAWMAGRWIHPESSVMRIALVFAVCLAVILGLGALYLACFPGMNISRAWILGVLPFLPGSALKGATACLLYSMVRRRIS